VRAGSAFSTHSITLAAQQGLSTQVIGPVFLLPRRLLSMEDLFAGVPIWSVLAAAVALIALVGVVVYRRRVSHEPPKGLDLALDAPVEAPEALVAVSELDREYRQRSGALKQRDQEISARRHSLEGRSYESLDLEALLSAATEQERANLATILKLPQDASTVTLAEGMGKAGSHLVGTLARRGRGVAYHEVAGDVAAKLKLPKLAEGLPVYEQERQVLTAAFDRILAEASPEQREAILAELAKQRGSALGLGAGTAVMVAANLSGFALYTAASTTLAAITGAVGVTLPFATYMGLSSAIATLTGPLGWTALALWAFAALGGANYKKTIPAVILVGTVRTRLIAERDHELAALAEEQVALAREWLPLKRLRGFLDDLGPVAKDHKVRVSELPG
jgi:uncharacterized protein YaaW (UPF0174 family)